MTNRIIINEESAVKLCRELPELLYLFDNLKDKIIEFGSGIRRLPCPGGVHLRRYTSARENTGLYRVRKYGAERVRHDRTNRDISYNHTRHYKRKQAKKRLCRAVVFLLALMSRQKSEGRWQDRDSGTSSGPKSRISRRRGMRQAADKDSKKSAAVRMDFYGSFP